MIQPFCYDIYNRCSITCSYTCACVWYYLIYGLTGYLWEKDASKMKRHIEPNVSLNLEGISEAEVERKLNISPDADSSLEAEVAAQTVDLLMMPEPGNPTRILCVLQVDRQLSTV